MSNFMESYRGFMERNCDPRTKDWWMMSGPAPLATVLITYVYFSVSAGPRYMRDKKPYDLKYVLIVYNAIQVFWSAYLVHEGLYGGWINEYDYKCQPVDYSTSPTAMRMANAVWWYFFAKVVELLDTVFFVLRKKNNQISFLHVYHHSIMPVCAWIGVKFLPGGHGTLLGVINSFIHIIMYSYYLLAGLGPQYQKYLWWKKYVTRLQLIQFLIIFIHCVQVLPRECNYPKGIIVLLTINASFFIYLFGSFYIKTYLKSTKKVKKPLEEKVTISKGVLTNGSGSQNGKLVDANGKKICENVIEDMTCNLRNISNGNEKRKEQ